MKPYATPEIPPQLQADWHANPALQEAHHRLQQYDLQSYLRTSPIARTALNELQTGEDIRYVDICPEGVADPKDALFVMHPFATGWGEQSAQMAVRYELMLAALPEPRRLLVFPSAVRETPVARYAYPELRQLAAGNYSPLSSRVIRTFHQLGVSRIQTVGYSQGAATGANVLAHASEMGIATGDSGLFDMPNIVERGRLELMRAFLRTGDEIGRQALVASQVPLLLEMHQPRRGLGNAGAMIGYARTALGRQNRAMANGLRHAKFARDADTFLRHSPEARLLCMRAEKSAVTPAEAFRKAVRYMSHYQDRVKSVEIDDVGHEFGDLVIAHALLAARALYPDRRIAQPEPAY